MEFLHKILFRVSVQHQFYTAGNSPGLRFYPTAACQQLLEAHRFRFKPTTDGFIIIAENTNASGADELVITPEVNTGFCFFITMARPDFLNITDTDLALYSGNRKFFFRNTLLDPAVIAGPLTTYTIHNLTPITQTLLLAPAEFQAPVQLADDPFRLVLRNSQSQVVADKIVPRNPLGQIVAESITLTSNGAFAEDLYTLQQVNSLGAVVSEARFFLSTENPADAAGVLLLTYNNLLEVSASEEFHFLVKLSNRKIKWVYRVTVTDTGNAAQNYDPNDIRLNDVLSDVPNTQGILGTAFTKTLLPGPLQPGVLALIEFESTLPIALRETPYQGVMLLEDGAGPPVKLVKNLPNPYPLTLSSTGVVGQYQSEVAISIK